jgi:hypothetical protein
MSERQGTWGQWQAVAASGLVVIFLMGAGGSAGVQLSSWLGIPEAIGWVVGLIAGYLLSRPVTTWVLSHTIYRDEAR